MRKRFGSAPEAHRKAARGEGEVARARLADARHYIGKGNCAAAFSNLAQALWRMGAARAESHGYRSAGLRERRSRKYGLTLTRLQRRFRDACVKK